MTASASGAAEDVTAGREGELASGASGAAEGVPGAGEGELASGASGASGASVASGEEAEPPLPAVHERPWAVGVQLAFTALVGLAWAAPIAATVSRVTGAYPRGDAELFDRGGVMLVEAARSVMASASAIGAGAAVVAALALPASLVVLGFVLAQLAARRAAGPRLSLARAVRAVPALVAIGLVALVAHAVALALVMKGGGEIARSTWPWPPPRDVARLALYGAAALVASLIGVVHDLARAAAVSGPSRAYVALRTALRTFTRAPLRATWAYAWRALAALACVAAAAWIGTWLGQRTAAALTATALAHQIGLAAAGWLRLSWLSQAVHLITPLLPRRPHPLATASSPRDSA